MVLWNDKRPGRGLTDGPRVVGNVEHAKLSATFDKSFAALKAAGLEHDADHPIAAEYRRASNAVNHANRSRDFSIATGRTLPA